MKNSIKSNRYTVTLRNTWEKYSGHLEDAPTAPVCVLSSTALDAVARDALEKSCRALEYPEKPCFYLVVSSPKASGGEAPGETKTPGVTKTVETTEGESRSENPNKMEKSGKAGASKLTAAQLLEAVEGIDPFRLVVTDALAAELCSDAYRRELPLHELTSLLERPTLAFQSFEAMLSGEATKQQAWRLLKRLLGLS